MNSFFLHNYLFKISHFTVLIMYNRNTLTQYQNFLQVKVNDWDLWIYHAIFCSFQIWTTLSTTHWQSKSTEWRTEAANCKTYTWQKAGNAGLTKVRWLGWAVSCVCINYSWYTQNIQTTYIKSCRHMHNWRHQHRTSPSRNKLLL